jgi:hypothetical protein
VTRYFWFLLLGLSGIVYSISCLLINSENSLLTFPVTDLYPNSAAISDLPATLCLSLLNILISISDKLCISVFLSWASFWPRLVFPYACH